MSTTDPSVITGSDDAEFLFGDASDNVLLGLGGDDKILAGDGDDKIVAGDGNDVVSGGAGSDRIYGGAGFDLAVYAGSIFDYEITELGGADLLTEIRELATGDTDTLTGIEYLYFEEEDYLLYLDGRNNVALGIDDALATTENAPLVISSADLLSNDIDFDGDTLSIRAASATSTLGVTITLEGGVITYDQGSSFDYLAAGETVVDTFTYEVEDGFGGWTSATVSITITGENDAPELSASDATIDENSTAIPAAISATDVDGTSITFSISGTDAALFQIDAATGALSFIAAPDFEAPGDADGDNVYVVDVTATDADGGASTESIEITVADVDEVPEVSARINEIHYDNAGSDTGEFVEIRVEAGGDVSGLLVEFYNGNGGAVYNTVSVTGADLSSSDGTYDYYVLDVAGIQNGSPDGIALSNGGSLIEFLSYEGSFTAIGGAADGVASTDIGVSEPGSTPIGNSLQRAEGDSWDAAREETRGTANDAVAPLDARINEIHYDNAGSDTGEFVEIRVEAGGDVSGLLVEFYNGNGGAVYNTVSVTGADLSSSDGTYDYYVLDVAGIQNGGPDGIALSNGGSLIEFLSYEGSFTAIGGAADGVASTDIGVSEPGSTPIGESLQRGAGDTWDTPREETRGATNDSGTAPEGVVINELAVSTSGTDWEFVELFGAAGTSLDGYALIQIGGSTDFNPGEILSVISFDGGVIGDNGFFLASSAQAEATFGVTGDLSFANNTFTNGASTFLLVEGFTGAEDDDLDTDDDGTLDSTPYTNIVDEVALTDANSPLLYSDVVIGPDGNFLAPGAARSTDGTGDFEITSFSDSSTYTPTAGGTGGGGGNTPLLISEIQGQGGTSARVGEAVSITAVVTYVDSNGYYMQEEDSDADSDAATSEGIFIFTGTGNTAGVEVGQIRRVDGTVAEFQGETQLTNVTSSEVTGTATDLPTAAAVLLTPETSQADYEAVEGMRVSVTSGTSEEMTVIENFELGRFGQVTISAGSQTQPTQLFDAQTESADIAALSEDNANNRLVLEDGNPAQNPTSFEYIPVTAEEGDNGNGYLDSGDTFGPDGPTFRNGTEITEAIEGIMSHGSNGFGRPAEFQLIVDGQLTIDPETNTGAREPAPQDVGGDLQVASFNVLNYFTTLSGGTGPSGDLNPRGARTEGDLERQTDALVEQMLGTGAEVFAVQELENNGFGSASAIAALVAALNAEAATRGLAADYQFVDPTGGAAGGFIGTDAITTGIIYDAGAVTPIYADYLVFDEPSAAATFALADPLNAVVSSSDQLGDFQRNRPATAATFEDNESGETFTVVSNHFKSKGDSNLEDLADAAQAALDGGNTAITQAQIDALRADPNFDQGDGQGFWNQVRLDAAEEVVAWLEGAYLAGAQAAGGTETPVGEDFLILGDFNAYAEEDPTQSVRDNADYVDLIDTFIDGGQDDAFSFIFDGEAGTLDQAFASTGLADNVTGATEWHVNAQEPGLLGYSTRFDDPAFFSADVYRAADHDPFILGLTFEDNPLAV